MAVPNMAVALNWAMGRSQESVRSLRASPRPPHTDGSGNMGVNSSAGDGPEGNLHPPDTGKWKKRDRAPELCPVALWEAKPVRRGWGVN